MCKYFYLFILSILLFYSCKTSKNTTSNIKDSIVYHIKDSVRLNIKDSVNYKTFDSSYYNQNLIYYKYDTVTKTAYKYLEVNTSAGDKKTKDSVHINYKDSTIYNFKDSTVINTKNETIDKKSDVFDSKKLIIIELIIVGAAFVYFKYLKK